MEYLKDNEMVEIYNNHLITWNEFTSCAQAWRFDGIEITCVVSVKDKLRFKALFRVKYELYRITGYNSKLGA